MTPRERLEFSPIDHRTSQGLERVEGPLGKSGDQS